MRSSNKSRSRNKNQNRRPNQNVVNRVFDSSGPEGKVRGTPQQIIEKYQALSRDASLAGDRVAAENFLQHSEHYARMLSEALREQNERREQYEQQNQNQNPNPNHQQNQRRDDRDDRDDDFDRQADLAGSEQPDIVDVSPSQEETSDLVETPESKAPRPPRRRSSKPKAKPEDGSSSAGSDGASAAETSAAE
jgi:hypothetical protein